ncbi:MAG: RNA polymerase sigma factor [Polyangiaceae bacterium]
MSTATMRKDATSNDLDDAALLARVRDGDLGALGGLFDRHEGAVRRIVERLGVAPGDVDDLVQTTFLAVPRAAERYDGRPDARPWLVGLAVREVRGHRRSLARWTRRLTAWAYEPKVDVPTPEREATVSRDVARTAEALARLSDKKRDVLVLVTLEGLSGEEVAAALDIPVATVWTRLHHARKEMLAHVFEEES